MLSLLSAVEEPEHTLNEENWLGAANLWCKEVSRKSFDKLACHKNPKYQSLLGPTLLTCQLNHQHLVSQLNRQHFINSAESSALYHLSWNISTLSSQLNPACWEFRWVSKAPCLSTGVVGACELKKKCQKASDIENTLCDDNKGCATVAWNKVRLYRDFGVHLWLLESQIVSWFWSAFVFAWKSDRIMILECTCPLKVHCHAIEWFYVDFFAVENGGEETRGRGAGQREVGLCRTFFFTSFELGDQSTLGYQSVTLAKSFLSRTKMGFEIRSRKWKQKDKFAHEKWGKFMETKTGLRSSTDRSWVVLVRRPFKTREAFRCSCVYFATRYNVLYDYRQAGHLLSALRLERCTAAIIFPRNKMAQKITE